MPDPYIQGFNDGVQFAMIMVSVIGIMGLILGIIRMILVKLKP